MRELVGEILGHYKILEQVGRGGTASVFKALDLNTQETVAVKVLIPQLMLEEKFPERFRREAKVLREFQHPHIVPVLDYGEANGLVYLVMPFMKVGTLSDRMESGEFEAQEGARILDQIASALQYAHDAGVVHRDVKPSNILIDENGNAWLSDFGFAHIADASFSLTGSALIGTPAYISPELVSGDKITPFSDQYSLAVVLYHMSTGYLPYEADTPLAVAIKHATDPLPRPRIVNPNLPDKVEAVLIKALSKDPTYRFNSISEFNDAFQTALSEALDSATGLLKPDSLSKIDVTLPLDPSELDEEKEESRELWYGGRSKWALLLLLLLACPLCWGIYNSGIIPAFSSGSDTQIAQISPTIDINATVYALSTENAPKEGTEVSPQDVETRVAATLTAMVPPTEIPTEDGPVLPTVFHSTITLTPIGSLTPGDGPLPSWTPVGMDTATPTLEPTNTPPGMPTATIGPSPTRTITRTVTKTPTVSRTPTNTPPGMPTFTPSRTPTITLTPSPTRTRTLTPTITLTPTKTYTLTPTRTRTPTVTKTPTVAIDCTDIILYNFSVDGQQVRWRINNTTGVPITITRIFIDWPNGHDSLNKIELGGDAIWDQGDTLPSDTLITSGWKGGASRSIPGSPAKTLMFQFGDEHEEGCYDLEVNFDVGGCMRSDYNRCDDD